MTTPPHRTVVTAQDVVTLLGSPSPDGQRSSRAFLAIPSTRAPRMLIPRDGKLAAQALRGARRPVTARDRTVTMAARIALRCGAARLLGEPVGAGDGKGLETRLGQVVGQEVRLAVFLGPPRANRKPVVQVLGSDGRLLAVAKIGVTPLAASLAVAEADALRQLTVDRPDGVSTPSLIAEMTWNGHPVVVQSALPIHQSKARVRREDAANVVRALRAAFGEDVESWATSSYGDRLRDRVRRLPDPRLVDTMLGLLDRALAPDSTLTLSASHGDLSVHNMAVSASGGLLAWDWERFDRRAPLGLDLLHHVFMQNGRKGSDLSGRGRRLLADAHSILAPLGVGGDEARQTAVLYLVEIGARFSGDGQAAAGGAAGDVARWIIPVAQDLSRNTTTKEADRG